RCVTTPPRGLTFLVAPALADAPGRPGSRMVHRQPGERAGAIADGKAIRQLDAKSCIVRGRGNAYKPKGDFPLGSCLMSESARFNMVEAQIRPSHVTDDRILAAMNAVPREKFVPGNARALAYADVPVQVAPGRYLLDPRSFAKLAQLAGIEA